MLLALALAVLGIVYTATHFRINTETTRLISEKVPWRQDEIGYSKAFPQLFDTIVAVVDGPTPEGVRRGSRPSGQGARRQAGNQQNLGDPTAMTNLAREGLLLLDKDDLKKQLGQIEQRAPFLTALAADPTLRGFMTTLGKAMETAGGGAEKEKEFEQFVTPLGRIATTIDDVLAGKKNTLSWELLFKPEPPTTGDTRRLVLIYPALDFAALQPGRVPIDEVRKAAQANGLTADNSLRLRLTGLVPLADEEFATVAENYELNIGGTMLAVAGHPLSRLAIGQDHRCRARDIRCRACDHRWNRPVDDRRTQPHLGRLRRSLHRSWRRLRHPVLDPLPRGTIRGRRTRARPHRRDAAPRPLPDPCCNLAGRGLLLLPADGISWRVRTRTDRRRRHDHRLHCDDDVPAGAPGPAESTTSRQSRSRPPPFRPSTTGSSTIANLSSRSLRLSFLAGLPFLLKLEFDSNPMHLRSSKVESVSTFEDLAKDPHTAPNTISVIEPNRAALDTMAAKLAALPEVSQVVSLSTFLPKDQDEKLGAGQRCARQAWRGPGPKKSAGAGRFCDGQIDRSGPRHAEDRRGTGRA